MSNYSPKHNGTSPENNSSSTKSKSTKPLIIVLIAILVIVVAVALVAIFNNGNDPVFGIFNSTSSSSATVATTSLTKYYTNGETPTTGTRHDVTLIADGGASVSELTGLWRYDDVTSYEFDGQGRGIMHTAVDRYTFRYSAENGVLDIDFDVDDAMDAEFTYTLSGDTLTISRESISYEMTKAD